MSKYSPKENISRNLEGKLESGVLEQLKGIPVLDKDDLNAGEIAALDGALFTPAEYDEKGAERSGYSNYSYWRSTVRMFFKNKLAVAMLAVMMTLVIFTFIQPLLPNQIDPNLINHYDDSAVWVKVDEDSKMEVSGIKFTRGDYAIDPGEDATLAYVNVPKSWGVPQIFIQAAGGLEQEQVSAEKDEANPGWYYLAVPKEKPYMMVNSEDGTKSTFHRAAWISIDEATRGVGTGGSKLTNGELITGGPENTVLVYINPPASWGKPNVNATPAMSRGTAGTPIEFAPDPENEGWYYAFVPEDLMMLEITSEDGSVKAANKGLARLTDPTAITVQTGFITNERPNSVYWFGTNDIGQDLWARMWSGSRNSLFIGIAVALIEALVGILAGLLWGYVRKLDFIFTEIYNIINNIPSTIILILASYIMRPSVPTLIIAMCITGWIGLARFIRNQVIIIRDRDFNLASRCLGTPTRRIIMKNLLPQMVSVVMLRMALAIPGAIGSEVFLGYIGLGLPIDIPSLGNLINKGRSLMMAPSLRYQLIIPAIILSMITICFYLVGNAFSDAADPKNHV